MFNEKQLDKLQEDGYLFFKLNEEDTQKLRLVRDEALTFDNIKNIEYRYNRRTPSFRDENNQSIYGINVSINPKPTIDIDWENMLEELSGWANLQKFFTQTITNSNGKLHFFDGRCEVASTERSEWDGIVPILEKIFNSCYTNNPKNDGIGYDKRYDINGRIMFKDMWLESHCDGTYGSERFCTILLYANEDWKPGDGGELVCDGDVLEPTLGNAAILDFTQGNDVEHGVNPILTDFIRRSWTIFVDKDMTIDE